MKTYQFIVIEFTLMCILAGVGALVLWMPKIWQILALIGFSLVK